MNGIAEICQTAQDTEHFPSDLPPERSFLRKRLLPSNQTQRATLCLCSEYGNINIKIQASCF